MSKIKSIIETRIDTCNINYNISINDVIDAVMQLKSGKSDISLNSDHFIHVTNKLYAILALLFTSLLLHGYSPDSMILGTMITFLKIRGLVYVILVTIEPLRRAVCLVKF